MGPPSGRAPGSESEHHDSKEANGMLHHAQSNGQVSHGQGEEEADHDHDAEYTHDHSSSYNGARQPYNYNNNAPVSGSITGEHAHLSPEMTGSPNHPASGRATPRTASAPQPYYGQQSGYSTPPRVQPPSSNLYNVMSSERGTANGAASGEPYGSQSDINNGYPAQQPVLNGAPVSNKRGREDEEESRPSSRGPGGEVDLKRRKTFREGSVSGTSYDATLNRPRAAISQRTGGRR